MKTAHQLARELLAGPDLPIWHFDPSRAGCDDECDTSLSEPEVQENDAAEGLTEEQVAEAKEERCYTGKFLTICGETDEYGEAMSRTESDRLNALKMLSDRVHSNYDFNADPDRITLIVGAALNGEPRPEYATHKPHETNPNHSAHSASVSGLRYWGLNMNQPIIAPPATFSPDYKSAPLSPMATCAILMTPATNNETARGGNAGCSAPATDKSTPTAFYAPFKRGRTGRKGCSKYIQPETGSWVTLNPDGSCHLGAWHKHLGTLLEVAFELDQRRQYTDVWRIYMKNAMRERDEVLTALAALVAAEEASIDKFTAREIDGIEAAIKTAKAILSQHNH